MKPIDVQRPQPREPRIANDQLQRLDAVNADPEISRIATLPREHPAWTLDLWELSERAEALGAALRPLALRVLGFWDHTVRAIEVRMAGCTSMPQARISWTDRKPPGVVRRESRILA